MAPVCELPAKRPRLKAEWTVVGRTSPVVRISVNSSAATEEAQESEGELCLVGGFDDYLLCCYRPLCKWRSSVTSERLAVKLQSNGHTVTASTARV